MDFDAFSVHYILTDKPSFFFFELPLLTDDTIHSVVSVTQWPIEPFERKRYMC